MEVAIMGAGLSGLACAITLEKYGLKPTVFESRGQVEDRFVNGEIFFNILTKPIIDPLAYFANEYQLYLHPVGDIKKLHVFSENEAALITGNIGFNVIRGRRQDSLGQQLVKQFKGKVHYHSNYTYEDLKKDYTHIVLAMGDGAYAEAMENYERNFTVSLKGAIFEGEFDLYTAAAWLDNRFAPKGYGYLIPLSNKEANLVIAYPDYPENKEKNIEELWQLFLKKAQRDIKQTLKLVDQFQITNYIIGKCKIPRIGNTMYIGNCYGSIMPFLGFGQFSAIQTGVFAAYDLCGKGDYNRFVKSIDISYNNSLVMRKAMEKLDNRKFDLIVKSLNGRMGRIALNNDRLDLLTVISNILKPIIDIN